MIQTKELDSADPVDFLSIRASNVMATQELSLDVNPDLNAGDLTRSVVELMSLPDDTVWDLRDDLTSALLDETRSVGEQLAPGARVTLTPKAHLG